MAKKLMLAMVALLAGCDMPLSNMEAPRDPQVRQYVFQRCIENTSGPQRTTYSDWDEAIYACGDQADAASTYCPDGAKCIERIPDRASVRAILTTPKDQTNEG